MTRSSLSLLGLLALAATPLMAQPTGQPKLPVRTLTVDLASAKSYTLGTVTYVRSGLKPSEYRIGTDATLTGAAWKSFTEGATTQTKSGGVTRIQGTIQDGVPPQTGGCNPQYVLIRVYLQFRARVQIGQYQYSPIKGDSTCVYPGG